MTDEPQRSLSGYKSKVSEGSGEFENPNEGKPALSDSEEYILRLTAFPKVRQFPQIKTKRNPDGTEVRTTIQVDKAICVFEEAVTKNQIIAYFRVDSLNFADEEAYESGIIKFFRKLKHPLKEHQPPNWDEYFVTGMRFRSRVVIGKDENKKPTNKYYVDVPTVRPLLSSDTNVSDAPKTDMAGANLANAMIIVHGCADAMSATQRLFDAKVSADVVQAFLQANKEGKITYPC